MFFERRNFGAWTCHLAGMSSGGGRGPIHHLFLAVALVWLSEEIDEKFSVVYSFQNIYSS